MRVNRFIVGWILWALGLLVWRCSGASDHRVQRRHHCNASGTLSLADKGIVNTQITKALPAP